MTAVYIILGVLALLGALYLFLVFPARWPKDRRGPFDGRYFAHRGLFQNDGPLPPENTCAAFEEACRAGFGSELDVQFTSDGQLIVFHDNDYKRAAGVDKKVWEVPLGEARSFNLFGRGYQVPLFTEVLDTVAGRAPLIIEIKAEERDNAAYYELCRRVNEVLLGYRGVYCIESFNPFVVHWWRRHRPDVMRGQLLNGPAGYPRSLPAPVRWLLGKLMLDCLGRPHFVAYNHLDRPRALDLNRRLGAMAVMWTVKNAEDGARLEKNNDTIIFDSYRPAGPDFAARGQHCRPTE